MSLAELVSTYGYLAVLIGTFFEGETVLILGGVSAHRGYLALPWVIACAFIGSFLGDQLYFFIGRAKGDKFLRKYPKWEKKTKKVYALLHKNQVLLILGFRFLYGIRTVVPFVIGSSGIKPLNFLLLNIIGTAIWTLLFSICGYFFGHAIELFIEDIEQYELYFFAIVIFVGFIIWLKK